ncbi:conjugative transfer ATPase, partial [Pseudomonas syringae]
MRAGYSGNRTATWKAWLHRLRPRVTLADEAALYAHNPSFTDHLPWVEYHDTEQCFLLDDNRSVGAVFELLPIGTVVRAPDWLMAARDSLEDALQDSCYEMGQAPRVAQYFCQYGTDLYAYLTRLTVSLWDIEQG